MARKTRAAPSVKEWGAKEFLEAKSLCCELPQIESRLARLGLFVTMHAVNGATRAIGWELERQVRKRMSRHG